MDLVIHMYRLSEKFFSLEYINCNPHFNLERRKDIMNSFYLKYFLQILKSIATSELILPLGSATTCDGLDDFFDDLYEDYEVMNKLDRFSEYLLSLNWGAIV